LPQSYIEQVQINKLTADFSKITENLKREISNLGESSRQSIDDPGFGKSPPCLAQISNEMSRSLNLRSITEPVLSSFIGIPQSAPRTDQSSVGDRLASSLPSVVAKPKASRALFDEEDKVSMKEIRDQLARVQAKLDAAPTAALQAEVQALTLATKVLGDEVKRLGSAGKISSSSGIHFTRSLGLTMHAGFAVGLIAGCVVSLLVGRRS
jgi:hypothetical protein